MTKKPKSKAHAKAKPLSFKQLVVRSLKETGFAADLRRLAGDAATDDAALAELRQTFALTPAELNKLGFSAKDEKRLIERCTVPTLVHLVDFVNFLP
jgi:hypothetical protein